MFTFNRNQINYKKFINHLCDFKALELNSTLQQIFLNIFLTNFRFLSLSNKNGFYFLRYDLLSLPQHSVFLKKSGLARAQINQLDYKYTTSLVSVDSRTFQFLKGGDMTQPFKKGSFIQLGDLLVQNRGLNVYWNDGTFLKHLLFWEQVYAPGLLMLQGFSNWHAFFLKEREWFFFSSWAKKEVNYILMLILISRGFSEVLNHYMPYYVIKELHVFLKKTGPFADNKNHLTPFYMWMFDVLRWSSFLGGGRYVSKKLVYQEENRLRIKKFLYDEEIIFFGGWMQAHKNDLIKEIRYWVYPQVEEFKNEELFEELIEMEDVYDTDIIADDAFIENSDIFVWPWTKFWDRYQALDFMKSKSFFSEVNDLNEHELLISFYHSIGNLENRLKPTPTGEQVFDYFEQTFKVSAWNDLSRWFKFFYPKTFNSIQLIGFNRYPLLLLSSFFISKLNGLFLYGFQGFDRRNIFFRLFFFVVLKYRGFCFKWFSILLKKVAYKLPWEEELIYVLHVLGQDQLFFQEVCKKKLYDYFFLQDAFLEKKAEGKNPFLYFFQFFFENYWGNLVLDKRKELYPDFMQKTTQLLFKNPKVLNKYLFKVTIHVYFVLLWGFIQNPKSLIKYLRFYEARFDSNRTRVFGDTCESSTRNMKGGSYHSFFKYKHKLEKLLKETAYMNKYVHTTTEGYLNEFFLRKEFSLPVALLRTKPQIWRTILFLFFYSYKQVYIYVFEVLKQIVSVFIVFITSGFLSASAYKLSEYYLKFFSPYSDEWPEYKKDVKFVYHIGLKKEFKQILSREHRFLFFKRWWVYLSSFREVFKFHLVLNFFLKVCWFYLIRAIYRILLNCYKFFWYRLFIYRRWLWRIKNTAKLRFYDWSPDLDRSIIRGISRETKIAEARDRSEAKDESDQPDFIVFLKDKIEANESPFKDELWHEMYKWMISLVFYRKLRKKSFVLKKEFTYMFGETYSNFVVKFLLDFKFWSFFFTYTSLFLLRSLLLTIIFFFLSFSSIIYEMILLLIAWLRQMNLQVKFKFLLLSVFVVFYSVFYGSFILFLYSSLFFIFNCILLFKFFKWALILLVYLLQSFSLFFLISPFVKIYMNLRFFLTDVWMTLKFNCYWILVFLFSWWGFVRFVVLLTLGFLVFLLVTIWYNLKGALFNKIVRKDYSTTLFFLFKNESSIFYHDFKDFFFFLSFFFKSFCLILSFFMFLMGQMGWKLVKFIFGEGYESDALKIKPELPTKKVFQFLDLYIKLFFFNLRESSLTKLNFCVFFIYSLVVGFSSLLFKFSGLMIFVLVFLYNFIFSVFREMRIHYFQEAFINNFSSNLSLCFTFFISCVYNLKLKLFPRSLRKKDKKDIFQLKNNIKRVKMTLPRLVLFRISFVLFNGSFSKFFFTWFWGFLKINKSRLNVKRDLQEILVFIITIYEFSIFYWAYLQKLSIELGELGWWLSYYDKYKDKFFGMSWENKGKDFIKKPVRTTITLFSKRHSYYLHLNNSFPAIQRYRPYIINKIYVEKPTIPFKHKSFFNNFFKTGSIFKRIASFLGLSFFFEILFLRFQQPISLFLFGDKKKIFPAHVVMRLKYFKDFFSEANWLMHFTYDSKSYGSDHFFIRFLPNFFTESKTRSNYIEKHRRNWVYKVFITIRPTVIDLLPKFRWNFSKLFQGILKFSFLFLTYTLSLMLLIIIVSFLVHFFFYFFIFNLFRVFFLWFFIFVERFWFFLFTGFFSFLLLVLYTLGFIFF